MKKLISNKLIQDYVREEIQRDPEIIPYIQRSKGKRMKGRLLKQYKERNLTPVPNYLKQLQ